MMILCQVVSVNRLRDWKTGFQPVAICVATVYDRQTGQRSVFRTMGTSYFALASAFLSAVALANASLYDARSIA
jgi:hypothetical protein